MLALEYGKRTKFKSLMPGQTIYFRGIGCPSHDNCFNCPKNDCDYRPNEDTARRYIWNGDALLEAMGNA